MAAMVERAQSWASVLARNGIEHLNQVRTCGNIMGVLTASVRPDLYVDIVSAVLHIGVIHPIICAITWGVSYAVPKSLFECINKRYGWRMAGMIEYLAIHLSLYAALDRVGIMPGESAGIIANLLKPFGLFVTCGLITYYSDRVFPTGSRKWACVAEVIACMAAAAFIGMCI